MVKILFDNSIFLHQKVGGISKYITELNDRLIYNNVESKIFSPISINEYLDNKKSNNVYWFKFLKIPKFCRKFFFTFNNFALYFYIKFYKPDILHFSYYNSDLLKYIKIPYVLTIYDLIHEKKKLRQNQFNKKNIILGAKHILCISKKTKKDLSKFYKIDKKKISVTYLGVDKSKKIEVLKKKKKLILYVGDRSRYKNFKNLIYAFSRSNYLKKNFKILCFGGEYFSGFENNLFKKLNVSKKILFKDGKDFDLRRSYRESSLFISVSLEEGFGLPPLEAMKYNCPTICSNIDVFREIFEDGTYFVEPKNVDNIKKGLEKVLKSKKLQKKLIKKGQKIVKNFSWDNCAVETKKIYHKVLNQ